MQQLRELQQRLETVEAQGRVERVDVADRSVRFSADQTPPKDAATATPSDGGQGSAELELGESDARETRGTVSPRCENPSSVSPSVDAGNMDLQPRPSPHATNAGSTDSQPHPDSQQVTITGTTAIQPHLSVQPHPGPQITDAFSALLAHQLPPLQKYSGELTASDGETFRDWKEQFELVASACKWDPQAKLVNLVTRLRGQAYAFYRSCTPLQRSSYDALMGQLSKWFTPVRIQAIESSLFHERKQKPETVDAYAQDL